MKSYSIPFVILLFSFFPVLPSLAKESPLANEVQIRINTVIVSGPYDPNTDVSVAVQGLFQNSCYAWSRAEVRNIDDYNHEIKTFASVQQSPCLMILTPFEQEIHFGRLLSGEHNLKFLNGDGTYLEDSLSVNYTKDGINLGKPF